MSETSPQISEGKIISYASMYLPVSMALLPVALYVVPFYAELGYSEPSEDLRLLRRSD